MVFKQISQFSQILKQAQSLGGKMEELRQQLRQQRVTGNAGGGLVEVEMTGEGEVVRVRIDPALIERRETEMIEDLLVAAFNQTAAKAKQAMTEAVSQLTGGLDLSSIPGLEGGLPKFTP